MKIKIYDENKHLKDKLFYFLHVNVYFSVVDRFKSIHFFAFLTTTMFFNFSRLQHAAN